MTDPTTISADSPDLLAALVDLDGVLAAAAAPTADAVRVELCGDRAEGAVVEEIEALLRARFGVAAASTSTVEEIGGIEGEGRLALERLVLIAGEGGIRADVVVRLDERSAPGSATGTGSDDGAVITTALLLALEELTEDAVIGTIERAGIDADDVARVHLRLDVDGSDVPTSAEAAVVRHRPQAIVRAVLAAVEPHLPG